VILAGCLVTVSSICFQRAICPIGAGLVRATKKRENQQVQLDTSVAEGDRIENTAPKGMNDRTD